MWRMADDVSFYAPNQPPTLPPQSRSGELLFEFYRERDHGRWRCEPRDHGETYGVEAQFWQNEEFVLGWRFDRRMDPTRTPRELAVPWAEEERKAIER
jgi:hypothetical protein